MVLIEELPGPRHTADGAVPLLASRRPGLGSSHAPPPRELRWKITPKPKGAQHVMPALTPNRGPQHAFSALLPASGNEQSGSTVSKPDFQGLAPSCCESATPAGPAAHTAQIYSTKQVDFHWIANTCGSAGPLSRLADVPAAAVYHQI